MNYTTAVFLINDNVRAIKAIYEADTTNRLADRETLKTIDPSIKVGDFIIAPTDGRHNMSVLKVVEVDVRIDIESSAKIRWVVDKIDRTSFEKISSWEETAIQKMQNAEALKKRKELKATMAEYFEDIQPLALESSVKDEEKAA